MHRKYIKRFIIPFLMGMGTVLSGCAGSGGSTRKKMPEFNDDGNAFEYGQPFHTNRTERSTYGLGFTTSNVDMMSDGSLALCTAVSIPPAADEQVMNLLSVYKPLAGSLILQWSKQQRNGVVLDFRTKGGYEQERADFRIDGSDHTGVPVIFLWDKQSSVRASTYMSMLTGFPDLPVTRVNSK